MCPKDTQAPATKDRYDSTSPLNEPALISMQLQHYASGPMGDGSLNEALQVRTVQVSLIPSPYSCKSIPIAAYRQRRVFDSQFSWTSTRWIPRSGTIRVFHINNHALIIMPLQPVPMRFGSLNQSNPQQDDHGHGRHAQDDRQVRISIHLLFPTSMAYLVCVDGRAWPW